MQLVVLLGCLDDGSEVQPTKALELLGLLGDAVELFEDLLQKLVTLCLAELWLRRCLAGVREETLALFVFSIAVLAILLVVRLDANGQWL